MNSLYQRINLIIPPERIQYYNSQTRFWIISFPWEKISFFFEAKKVKYDGEFHLTMRNHMNELVSRPFEFRVKK